MNNFNKMDDNEILIKGIEALNKSLGSSATLRFLTLFNQSSTDYVEVSQRLYEGQRIEEIFERAKQNWKDQ